ncbi:NUDIX domain-containing protein [Haliangium sp.]|uniref:NUDIX domain-containing protein n=1 Tax=Haliangium sp. TaxID=2663208 RepID=UPI003D09ACC3
MSRNAIPTWCFVVVIVRRGDRFLLVHERKHGQRWYFPAGRVEPGETLARAALRETLEETAVPVELDGILRIEHTPMVESARMRVLYTAHAADDTPPKSVPDEESLAAGWFTLDQLTELPLRGDDVRHVLTDVARGAPIYPLSLIAPEGSPLLAK